MARVATVPPAPPRFSTTTCWPSVLLIRSATSRASASLPPPAGNGTTSVTARFGKVCAEAVSIPAPPIAHATIAVKRIVDLIPSSRRGAPIIGRWRLPQFSAVALLFEEFFGTHGEVLWRAQDLLDGLLHRLAIDRIDLEIHLRGILEEFGILHGRAERVPQRGEA